MFKKLLRKVMGRKAAIVADAVLETAADAVTGGKASELEQALKKERRTKP
jgi:hypothetical protein